MEIFNDNKYFEPSSMIGILEDLVGKSYSDIRNDVVNSEVLVSDRDVVNYLNQQFLDCDPDVLMRVNNSGLKHLNCDKLFGEDQFHYMNKYSHVFDDYLVVRKYTFEPYSLEYFKKYISILKDKILFLLDNYYLISCGCPNFDLLEQLDIILDSDGLISKDDIYRLINPILYNLNDFGNKVLQANDLSTYLSFKMSRFLIYKNGLSFDDIYPRRALQVDNLISDEDGYVPLTFNQRNKLSKVKKICK